MFWSSNNPPELEYHRFTLLYTKRFNVTKWFVNAYQNSAFMSKPFHELNLCFLNYNVIWRDVQFLIHLLQQLSMNTTSPACVSWFWLCTCSKTRWAQKEKAAVFLAMHILFNISMCTRVEIWAHCQQNITVRMFTQFSRLSVKEI